MLEVIARPTERVLEAQRPHLNALDSLRALRSWRDAIVRLNRAAQGKGCPLGSLTSELANDSEPARKRLAGSFAMGRDRLEQGLAKMRERRGPRLVFPSGRSRSCTIRSSRSRNASA